MAQLAIRLPKITASKPKLKQLRVMGIPCVIEHAKGTIRHFKDDQGNTVWHKLMHSHYGYIKKTKGRDGDEVDVMIGPLKSFSEAYIIHMLDKGPVPSEREDEDKVMLGWPSSNAAKQGFLQQYPESFYGGMTSLPLSEFKNKLATAQLPHREKKIHANLKKSLGEIDSGGVGSGCVGPNCGRPKQSFHVPSGVDTESAKTIPLRSSWVKHNHWRSQAYGGVVVNEHGEFLLREPTKHFDGYNWTWPKGKMSWKYEHPADTATREVGEETGHNVRIFGQLPGTYWHPHSDSYSSFYLMKSTGVDPSKMDRETQSVKWADYDTAKHLIEQSTNKYGKLRDLAILDEAQKQMERITDKHNNKLDAVGLSEYKVNAGGEGSGWFAPSHGPRGGVAVKLATGKNSTSVMEEHGWKKTAKWFTKAGTNSGPKFYKSGPGLAGHTVFEHPKFGKIELDHHTKEFTHFNKAGDIIKPHSPTGKNAIEIEKYMSKLHMNNVEKPPVKEPIPNPSYDTDTKPTPLKSFSEMTPQEQFDKMNSILEQKGWLHEGTNDYGTKTWYKSHSDESIADDKVIVFNPKGTAFKTGNFYKIQTGTVNFVYGKDISNFIKDVDTVGNSKTSAPFTQPTKENLGKELTRYGFAPTTKSGDFQFYQHPNGDIAKVAEGQWHLNPKYSGNYVGISVKTLQNALSKWKDDNTSNTTLTTPVKQEPLTPINISDYKSEPNNITKIYDVAPGNQLGGAHDKYVLTQKMGNASAPKQLFKPATDMSGKSIPAMAAADQLVSDIQQKLRPDTFNVGAKAVTLDLPDSKDTLGSIQNMVPSDGPNTLRSNKDFTNRDFDKVPLQPWEIKGLQEEQVVDWLISNHDSHPGQFLRLLDRQVVGIDKSQAFKYFPDDKLEANYHPNAKYGENPPIYNTMAEMVKAGKLTLDPNNAESVINKAQAISDKDYQKMLAPYAAARYNNDAQANEFIQKAVDRKNSLRTDFEKYYSDILGKPFKFAQPDVIPEQTTKSITKAIGLPDALVTATSKLKEYGYKGPNLPYSGAYPIANEKTDYKEYDIDKWNTAYNKLADGKDKQQALVTSAKGMGVYPEVAASQGVTPIDMKDAMQMIRDWTHSSHGLPEKATLQKVVDGNCCANSTLKALAVEQAITTAKLKQTEGDKVTLYRGVDKVAVNNTTKGANAVYKAWGADSWSDDPDVWSGQVKMVAKIPVEFVLSSYKSNPLIFDAHPDEREYIVAFPNKVGTVKIHEGYS